ncbi:MAG: hypothetical protein ACHQIM_06880 [Sphingobacteriales bacterium]
MQKTNIRQKLHPFKVEDIKEFDKRRAKRLRGESITYSWEQAKQIILNRNLNKIITLFAFMLFTLSIACGN